MLLQEHVDETNLEGFGGHESVCIDEVQPDREGGRRDD